MGYALQRTPLTADQVIPGKPFQNLAVGTTLAAVTSFYCQGDVASITVENLGTNSSSAAPLTNSAALTGFSVGAKFHPSDATFQTIVSGSNSGVVGGFVKETSGNLANLGSNTAGFIVLSTFGANELQFSLAATAATSVNINYTATDT